MALNQITIEVQGEPATAVQYLGNEEPTEARRCTEGRDGLKPVPDGMEVFGFTLLGVPTGSGWKELNNTDWFVTKQNGVQALIPDNIFQFMYGNQLTK